MINKSDILSKNSSVAGRALYRIDWLIDQLINAIHQISENSSVTKLCIRLIDWFIHWLIDYCHLPKLSNSDIISENSSVTKLCIRLIDWFIHWLIDWLIIVTYPNSLTPILYLRIAPWLSSGPGWSHIT